VPTFNIMVMGKVICTTSYAVLKYSNNILC
jgi:hypothetical protein